MKHPIFHSPVKIADIENIAKAEAALFGYNGEPIVEKGSLSYHLTALINGGEGARYARARIRSMLANPLGGGR